MRIMIVEDEDLLRNGLIKMIGRMDMKCTVIASASNGEDALEQLANINVDLIITDIRMPKKDGLQLLQEVSAFYPNIRTVILSGYNDFEYAKRGIQLGCKDYLLKPPGFADLQELIQNIKNELDSERNNLMDQIKKVEMINQNQDVIRNEFLRSLISMHYTVSRKEMIRKAEAQGLQLHDDRYSLILLQLDKKRDVRARFTAFDWSLMKYAIKNMTQEITGSHLSFYDEGGHFVILHRCRDEDEVLTLSKEVQNKVKHFLNLSVSAGISEPHQITNLFAAYDEAIQALRLRLIKEDSTILTYRELLEYRNMLAEPFIQRLKSILEMDQANTVIQLIREWTNEVKEARFRIHVLETLVKEFEITMLTLLNKFIGNQPGSSEKIRKTMEQVDSADSLYEKWLLILALLNQVNHEDNLSFIANKTVMRAMQYIEENYNSSLTLAKVAEHVFMTPAYFSVIFKKHMKKGVVDYVTEIRLQHAKKLLLMHPEMKTYEIADKVGFQDAAYFSNQFKKYVGCTPIEYRNH